MEIKLTPQESENYFYNALCNGLDYLSDYGLILDTHEDEYVAAKKRLEQKNESTCYEDILMEILKGGGHLTLIDNEGCEEDATITLHEVHQRVSLTPLPHLFNMITEDDDAETADVMLQTVFLEDIVYG